MIRQPPANNLNTLALFLSIGHYDVLMQRLMSVYKSKWQELEDSLNYYFPQTGGARPAFSGTAFWIEGPEDLDSNKLAEVAKDQGILIEAGESFYSSGKVKHCFRLGFAAIPIQNIREGIANLARLTQQLLPPEHINTASGVLVQGDRLRELLTGSTLRAGDCYQVPFDVIFQKDGKMLGLSTHPGDEDEGYWWIENGRWCRQWKRWQFAEERSFSVMVHGKIFKWFDEAGWCVNQGILNPES